LEIVLLAWAMQRARSQGILYCWSADQCN
jgi:hypothetical protein